MPMEDAAQMLRTFALDLLQSVLQLATKVAVYTRQDIKAVCGTFVVSNGGIKEANILQTISQTLKSCCTL